MLKQAGMERGTRKQNVNGEQGRIVRRRELTRTKKAVWVEF